MNVIQGMGLYLILRMLRLILITIAASTEWHDAQAKDRFEKMFEQSLTEYTVQETAFLEKILKGDQ